MGVRYIKIISKTLTIFLVSSKRMNIIDSASPKPAVRNAKQIPTISASGKVQARVWPEMKTTIASGIKPIKKLTRPAKAAEIAKICGGT